MKLKNVYKKTSSILFLFIFLSIGWFLGRVTTKNATYTINSENKLLFPKIQFFPDTEFVDDLDIGEQDGYLYYDGKLFTGVSISDEPDGIKRYCWIKSGILDGPELLLNSENQLRSVEMNQQGVQTGVSIDFSEDGISEFKVGYTLKLESIDRMLLTNGRAYGVIIKDSNGVKQQRSLTRFDYVIPFSKSTQER